MGISSSQPEYTYCELRSLKYVYAGKYVYNAGILVNHTGSDDLIKKQIEIQIDQTVNFKMHGGNEFKKKIKELKVGIVKKCDNFDCCICKVK